MKAPKWALTIVDKVWENQYGPKPHVTWNIGGTTKRAANAFGGPTPSNAFYTSGHCEYYSNNIVINAGVKSPRWEQKMVLLHELAHAISPGGHDERFWLTAWTLYRAFNLPVRKCQERDSNRGAARRARLATGRGAKCPRVGGIR